VLFVSCFFLAACQVEERAVGPSEVKAPTPDTTLVSVADVLLQDGTRIGTLKTVRYEDEAGNTVTQVFDQKSRSVGYILEDGRSYRWRAHGAADLVSSSPILAENVAVLLGQPLDRVTIQVDARIR
jgi:hypothetical protein